MASVTRQAPGAAKLWVGSESASATGFAVGTCGYREVRYLGE